MTRIALMINQYDFGYLTGREEKIYAGGRMVEQANILQGVQALSVCSDMHGEASVRLEDVLALLKGGRA